MNDILRDRLHAEARHVPDDKLNQVLDYIDFLDSKYAPRDRASPESADAVCRGCGRARCGRGKSRRTRSRER